MIFKLEEEFLWKKSILGKVKSINKNYRTLNLKL